MLSNDSRPNEISFVLQMIKLLNYKEFDDGQINRNLLKLLRSNSVNDRLKAMAIKVLSVDDREDVLRMSGEGCKESAVICAAIKEKFDDYCAGKGIKSSSKLINLINGNYEEFTETECAILEEKYCMSNSPSEYEKYLRVLNGENIVISNPVILRRLFKNNKISCSEFVEYFHVKLEPVDHELIASKTSDPQSFWNSLNSIDFIVNDDMVAVKDSFLEYMMDKDIKSCSLPAQQCLFNLLNRSKTNDERFKLVAVELYNKYKDNFDGSAKVFKDFIDKF